MPPRTQKDILALRREAIARLRLRGLSIRAIEEALPKMKPPVVNPKTGKPYTKTTIGTDLKFMTGQWKEDASRAISEHQAEQLAILREVQANAWQKKDLDLVLKAHDRIAKLLGTNAPEKREISGNVTADLLVEAENRLVILHARLSPNTLEGPPPDALPDASG